MRVGARPVGQPSRSIHPCPAVGLPSQFFGEISYGVYLIVMLVFDLEDQAVGLLFHSASDQKYRLVIVLLTET